MRIGPDEVHVSDLRFLDTVYAPAPHRRDKETLRTLDISLSVAGTPGHNEHKMRRDALNPFFTKQAVAALEEPVLSQKIQKLEEYLSSCETGKTPANMSDIYYAFTVEYDFLLH